ncbi:MAG: hypothetical protein ABWZ25_07745 [Chitinophagaceae bacterium]
MDGAKIQLSKEEKELISNSKWILTKNDILLKVNAMLTGIMADQTEWLFSRQLQLPAALASHSPKISRGENYHGLPWMMLDQPRIFGKPDTFAIRIFFWWGHFFSITLQLEGSYKTSYQHTLSHATLADRNYLVAVTGNRWLHHPADDHYRAVSLMNADSFTNHIKDHPFVKLTSVTPLSDWEQIREKMSEEFSFLMGMLIT